MKTRRLITCDNDFRARLIQGALENEGIPAILHNENTSNVLRGLVPTISGVDIFVEEDDYEAALQLLAENQMLPEQQRYCPRCGSTDFRFRLKKGRRLRALLAAVMTIVTGVPPGSEHWEYVCNRCGAHFDAPVARPSGEGGGETENLTDKTNNL